ncbi:MAG: hypothetical protein EA382_15695 [Spirochaetaceae bacterium]|nr:MAG: hypothetical protein EA382_15695 [Spirochaetaceae bacterium]
MRRNLLVLINELGGSALARRIGPITDAVLSDAAIEHEVVSTRSMREIRRRAASARSDGFTEIVCVGGDGTVGMIANEVGDDSIVLSVIPGGTGNILAKHLTIPTQLRPALAVIVQSDRVVAIDAIDRDGRLYLLNLSMGLSSAAMTDIDGRMKRLLGMAAYFLGVLVHLARRGPVQFRVTVDGVTRRVRAREAMLTNAGFSQTALEPLFATSRADDGMIELSVFHMGGGRGLLALLSDVVFKRARLRSRYMLRLIAAESIELSSDPPLPVQADGDRIGDGSVRAVVRRGAVRFRVPDTY